MVLSAVPPPERRRPCWWGDQVTALTAATWSLYLTTGSFDFEFQMYNLLSLPPEQSCWPSGDHLSPQTSCLWLVSFEKKAPLHLGSLWSIVLSREPVHTISLFHAMEAILSVWPPMTLTLFILFKSQMWSYPLLVPKVKVGPFTDHPTEVTVSESPKSQSLVTFELFPFQR